jgi:serine/threonine protein kinase
MDVYDQESSMMSILKHPNIIAHLGSYTTPDSCVILTKYGGENLFDYMQSRGRLSEKELRPIVKSMFQAISFCHSNEICHGDVKLENFVISKNGRVRLIDFGLAESIPAGATSRKQCGSTFYRPPELITRAPHGLKIDVWGIGISVFALASQQFPFSSEDEYSNVVDVLFADADLSAIEERFSSEFVALVGSMLQKKPELRPTIDECLEAKWFRLDAN